MGAKKATIAASARVRGRIAGDEDLLVFGRVDGEIDLRGALDIDASAVVKARIRATAVRVAGTVVGDITATDVLHLAPTARVIGDLRAGRLVIEPGARVSGGVTVEEQKADGPRRTFESLSPMLGGPRFEARKPPPPQRATAVRMPTLEPEIVEPSDPPLGESQRPWTPPQRGRVETEGEIDAAPRRPLPQPSAVPETNKRRVTVKMKTRGEP